MWTTLLLFGINMFLFHWGLYIGWRIWGRKK